MAWDDPPIDDSAFHPPFEVIEADLRAQLAARDEEIARLRTTLDAVAKGLGDIPGRRQTAALVYVAIENLLRVIAAAKAAGGGG